MAAELKYDIPVLTDAVGRAAGDAPARSAQKEISPAEVAETLSADRESLIAELQTEIAASMFALTDEVMRRTFAEMEASIFEQISGQLRRELPEIIDMLLRERLGEDSEY